MFSFLETILRILLEFIKPNSEYDVFLAHKVMKWRKKILIASTYPISLDLSEIVPHRSEDLPAVWWKDWEKGTEVSISASQFYNKYFQLNIS